MEFKVGDKVQVINRYIFGQSVEVGDVAEIRTISHNKNLGLFFAEYELRQWLNIEWANKYIEKI